VLVKLQETQEMLEKSLESYRIERECNNSACKFTGDRGYSACIATGDSVYQNIACKATGDGIQEKCL
jgi:hypothetical protein